MDIVLSERVIEKIKKDSELSYPEECCGILFFRPDNDGITVISEAQLLENSAGKKDRSCRYVIDPLSVYAAEKKYGKMGYEPAGFYHSHPDAPAVCSTEDEKEMIPEMLYFIASVRNGKCFEIRGWRKEIEDEGYHISNFKNFF